MPKRKKRPWISTDVVDAAKSRDAAKALERREREAAFRDKHPERFVEEEAEAAASRQSRGSVDGMDGGDGVASSSGRRDEHGESHRRGERTGGDRRRESRRGGFGKGADLEAVDTDPKTFPTHPPCQTRDEISDVEFERRRARVEAVTREIGTCARHKQLKRACQMFVRLISVERMVPSPYTYASLLNAYVNTGSMDGAEALIERMREVGCAPNVVAYTTMLKGYMLVADVDAAWRTIEGMKHPVAPDSRAVNTYIRVCVRCGNLSKALDAFERMRDWDVVPDNSTHKLMGRLLAQGLKCDRLKSLIKSVKKGEHLRWTNDPANGQCQFWRSGRCERGVNCRFYHDPSIQQSDAQSRTIEADDLFANMHINLAHALAVTGDLKGCRKALSKASDHLVEQDEGASGGLKDKEERAELFRQTNRDELKLEMKRIEAFIDRMSSGDPGRASKLEEHLARTLIFSSQIQTLPPRGEDMTRGEVEALRTSLYDALKTTMGLSEEDGKVKKCINKVIGDDGKVRFRKMFGRSKKEQREMNLEVAAGNGDWAVAQAKADVESDWISLELRHDRVYSIFSRAVCSGASNFAAMGGDAAYVLRRHVAPESVSNVFINFPEPPHHSGDVAADNALALLNDDFFTDIHAGLRPGGGLTIFSDNHRYMQTLARMLADMQSFSNRDDADLSSGVPAEIFETIKGVRLYEGLPGRRCGHRVYEQSYFDRFWENGQHIDRYFISVAKS